MSLARAFTKRARRQHEASEGSFRYAAGTIERSKISLPTELLSTTNVHALNAPDIRSASSTSSNASLRSAEGSDFSSISKSFLTTPATSADNSSIESSPITPEPGQRKAFFDPTSPKRSATTATGRSSSGTQSSTDAPAIPQRAVSHSKKAHQDIARQRSLSRLTPPPTIMSNATVVRNSADMFAGAALEAAHPPFGNELAHVSEVAEDAGSGAAWLDQEEQEMRSKGLIKFNADDYVSEILGLWEGEHGDRLTGLASPWI
jgi:hypothetical protein